MRACACESGNQLVLQFGSFKFRPDLADNRTRDDHFSREVQQQIYLRRFHSNIVPPLFALSFATTRWCGFVLCRLSIWNFQRSRSKLSNSVTFLNRAKLLDKLGGRSALKIINSLAADGASDCIKRPKNQIDRRFIDNSLASQHRIKCAFDLVSNARHSIECDAGRISFDRVSAPSQSRNRFGVGATRLERKQVVSHLVEDLHRLIAEHREQFVEFSFRLIIHRMRYPSSRYAMPLLRCTIENLVESP